MDKDPGLWQFYDKRGRKESAQKLRAAVEAGTAEAYEAAELIFRVWDTDTLRLVDNLCNHTVRGLICFARQRALLPVQVPWYGKV